MSMNIVYTVTGFCSIQVDHNFHADVRWIQ